MTWVSECCRRTSTPTWLVGHVFYVMWQNGFKCLMGLTIMVVWISMLTGSLKHMNGMHITLTFSIIHVWICMKWCCAAFDVKIRYCPLVAVQWSAFTFLMRKHNISCRFLIKKHFEEIRAKKKGARKNEAALLCMLPYPTPSYLKLPLNGLHDPC